jgi:hypothetical protein
VVSRVERKICVFVFLRKLKFLRNLPRKRKLFAKTIPGTKIYRGNFRENENFRENFREIEDFRKKLSRKQKFRKTKFREKRADFRFFSLFAKMKKGGFVSTLVVSRWFRQVCSLLLRMTGSRIGHSTCSRTACSCTQVLFSLCLLNIDSSCFESLYSIASLDRAIPKYAIVNISMYCRIELKTSTQTSVANLWQIILAKSSEKFGR